MKIILIRHGQTLANAEKRYLGRTHSNYTEKGQKQVDAMIKNLSQRKEIEAIYTSPLPRCRMIAEKIGENLQLEIHQEDDLREIDFGIFENMTYQEIQKKYPEPWEQWARDIVHYKIPQGESLLEMENRIASFVKREINLGDPDKTILLVSHGGVIQSMITQILNLSIEDRWHFKIPTAAQVEIEIVDGYGILTKLG